jgi:hypothetical protein
MNNNKIEIANAKEQIQEDVICFVESYGFLSHPEFLKDNLCQIVVDNFKRLEVDIELKDKG